MVTTDELDDRVTVIEQHIGPDELDDITVNDIMVIAPDGTTKWTVSTFIAMKSPVVRGVDSINGTGEMWTFEAVLTSDANAQDLADELNALASAIESAYPSFFEDTFGEGFTVAVE